MHRFTAGAPTEHIRRIPGPRPLKDIPGILLYLIAAGAPAIAGVPLIPSEHSALNQSD
jgi:hypothetical protein